MSAYINHPLRRLHQLNATSGGLTPAWALGGQINFKMDDIPQTMTALGRKFVNYVAAIRLTFRGSATSTAGAQLPRKVLTPMLIQAIQVQGTEYGSPVSSSHMLGGIIDTNSYIRSGGKNNLANPPGLTLVAATPKAFKYSVDIFLGNFAQRNGHETCPLAVFMKPGEVVVNMPQALAALDASLTDVSISGMTVTAHAVILPSTKIIIANPWQMTRHQSTAGSGTESVMLNSFGAASTVTGVQSKCGLHSVLWAGSGLIGPAKGPGAVASITQFACDFLGIRQNNDPRAIIQQMFAEVTDGKVLDSGGSLEDHQQPIYPLFDNAGSAFADLDIATLAQFFPVLFPVTEFDASKLLDAVGNPSFDLTATVTQGAPHCVYVDGCYPFTMDKQNDLVAIIQRSHIGLEMFQTDDLILSTKLADNQQDLVAIAATNPELLTYLPRIVIPRASAAVK
jgi:hypothetical protein